MTSSAQLEATEAWRKAGFLVRPYHGHDEEDAKRFHKEILMALDGEMISVSRSGTHVLNPSTVYFEVVQRRSASRKRFALLPRRSKLEEG